MDYLKEKFGGLRETATLLWQDLQKIRERTTAMEGRVSDVEDQLPPLNRDVRMTTQQAFQALNKTNKIENQLFPLFTLWKAHTGCPRDPSHLVTLHD